MGLVLWKGRYEASSSPLTFSGFSDEQDSIAADMLKVKHWVA